MVSARCITIINCQFHIRILETKVYKNPIREAAKKLLKRKEDEVNQDLQRKILAVYI